MNIKGKTYNRLFVESFSHTLSHAGAFWNCICECGKKVIVRGCDLRNKITKSCGCLRLQIQRANSKSNHCLWKGYGELSGRQFQQFEKSAKKRKIDFKVTIQYLWDLFIKQNKKCALSGVELKFNSRSFKFDGNASPDRIDSSKGYIEGNLQWVHKDVNYMKQDHTDESFLKWCSIIHNYNLNK